jgi:hypothetical protein
MANHAVSYQSPRPEVVIWRPDKSGKPLRFDTSNLTVLQGYSFGTSVNDEKGRFTLTFYPDDDKIPVDQEAICDQIHPLDIVEIYETKNHFIQKTDYSRDSLGGRTDIVPTFVGVVREKKFAAQKTDNGMNRKLTVSGHSIAGLVQEFKVNIDMQATVITAELANNEEIQKQFTIKFIQTDNSPLKLGYVIKEIWKSFIDLSSQYGRSSNPKVGEYINKWIGSEEEIFNVDGSTIHYPIGSIFRGQTTQTFFDVISHLVPKPVYEIFPYLDYEKGKMRLMIRESPFDADIWNDTEKMPCTEIEPKLLKSFDVKQSDKEVYTVFFAYLSGFPIQEDKAIILAAQGVGDVPGVEIDREKFKTYGYRPLFVTFNGYGKADGEDDTGTGGRLQNLNIRLKNWFCNKDKAYSGTITMETDLSKDMPQAGEKVSFLGGQFYVVDSEHRWNYGGSPETAITIERGGNYSSGSFSELLGIAKRYKELKGLQNAS